MGCGGGDVAAAQSSLERSPETQVEKVTGMENSSVPMERALGEAGKMTPVSLLLDAKMCVPTQEGCPDRQRVLCC